MTIHEAMHMLVVRQHPEHPWDKISRYDWSKSYWLTGRDDYYYDLPYQDQLAYDEVKCLLCGEVLSKNITAQWEDHGAQHLKEYNLLALL